ncbi:MAG: glycoside hydrolase family 3 N-terminal domain-containing protein [Candidatus Nanopelagicales bacterium]
MLSDGPHGLRKQEVGGDHLGTTGSSPATCFLPAVTSVPGTRSCCTEVGAALGGEAAAEGVAVVLGPGLNIKRHPHCGRNFEYLSEDPLVAGRLAAALVDGIQSRGVGACLKHFAVNNQEAHRLVVDAVVDERTLRELYLAGFEWAVTQSRPWTVMAAYNAVNGTFCTDNRRLLTTILRDEWGFDGLVMSDWGPPTTGSPASARAWTWRCPAARCRTGMGGAAVADGSLARADVERCVDRVLALVGVRPTAPWANRSTRRTMSWRDGRPPRARCC